MGRIAVIAAVLGGALLAAAPAYADRLTESPALGKPRPLGERLKDQLNVLAEEVNTHLSAISFDLVAMRFDAHQNRAAIKVDTGPSETLGLRVDSDVQFRHGAARVKARVDLGLAGRRFSFDLPELDLVPRSFEGKRYVEVRLPIVEGNF